MLLRELRAQGYTGSYTILKNYLQPLRLRRAVTATVRFETKPGRAGAGRLRPVSLPDGGRPAAVVLGLRDGARLVAGALCGVRPPRRRGHLPPLSPARLRGVRRRAAVLSLRPHEGGRPGAGRRRAALECDLSRLRAPGRLRRAALPALPGPDERPRRERHQVRPLQLLADGAVRRSRRTSIARRTPGRSASPMSGSTGRRASGPSID